MYKVLFLHYYRIYKYFQLAFIFIFSCVTPSTFARFYKPYRVTPLLFFEEHPGIFNDHREPGPRFNVSSEGRCFFAV